MPYKDECLLCGGSGEGEYITEDQTKPCKRCGGNGLFYPADFVKEDFSAPEYQPDFITITQLNNEP